MARFSSPVRDNPGAREVEKIAWCGASEQTGEDGVQGGFVVGVTIVDDDVGCIGGVGDGVEAIIVALDYLDVWVGGLEGFRDFAEEDSDVVFWMGGCYCV